MYISYIIDIILLSPLLSSIISFLLIYKTKNYQNNNSLMTNIIIIILLIISFVFTLILSVNVYYYNNVYELDVFNWIVIQNFNITVSFLIDKLSCFMMIIITLISLLVNIYSMEYMYKEEGYYRFFSYISAFTFSMLCLVMSNNLVILFLGWELVGLFSYLLIGFYYKKQSANYASLYAFIINRIGDLSLILGIASIILYTNAIKYESIFNIISKLNNNHITLICVFCLLGAIVKSAQFPFHIWLEGSMEGPTPISALIHAATMVTAGVFVIARLSPIFIHSIIALSILIILGSITCFFMALIAMVENDIKRVIAYCTLSQLGYMIVAEGTSCFSIGLVHLITHAIFKALLFLSAGSVILALNHEQDMRKMGGLWKKMPITYISMIIGAISLSGIPPFSGFFSKDIIIEATKSAIFIPGHNFAYIMVIITSFITSFYIFRMIFITFHGPNNNIKHNVKESSYLILFPLIILSIISIFIGMFIFNYIVDKNNIYLFGNSIAYYLDDSLNHMTILHYLIQKQLITPTMEYIHHAFYSIPVWFSIMGIITAYIIYIVIPCYNIPKNFIKTKKYLLFVLKNKYFIEKIYHLIFIKGIFYFTKLLTIINILIDKFFVLSSKQLLIFTNKTLHKLHRRYLFDYALVILIGLLFLIIFSFLYAVKK